MYLANVSVLDVRCQITTLTILHDDHERVLE